MGVGDNSRTVVGLVGLGTVGLGRVGDGGLGGLLGGLGGLGTAPELGAGWGQLPNCETIAILH